MTPVTQWQLPLAAIEHRLIDLLADAEPNSDGTNSDRLTGTPTGSRESVATFNSPLAWPNMPIDIRRQLSKTSLHP
ncbi:hypothetical protein GCM10022251_44510 [Phytohabitans flavus]|uniref:Uncharacterized protein n=1 Tax=Phytohabitans flavus TaxID=1076124 RepID=A0A6F8XTA1_9ACTN|nr:hypothetical protein [Phytohabitans flavus]BCB76968.1 hypothetical protein Pflav_033780 [Phytohabitans flavus]